MRFTTLAASCALALAVSFSSVAPAQAQSVGAAKFCIAAGEAVRMAADARDHGMSQDRALKLERQGLADSDVTDPDKIATILKIYAVTAKVVYAHPNKTGLELQAEFVKGCLEQSAEDGK